MAEHLHVEARIPIRLGTLSKALGSHGGFVVGSRRLIDWLSNRARTYIYSTAAPEALAAAGLEALRIVAEEPWRRRQLLERAEWLRDQLRRRGWNVGSSRSQIIPLFVGDPREAAQLSAALRGHGYWVPAIRPPSVPPGESLLRLSLSHEHDATLLEGFLGALDRCAHS
jgi:7-keto-8-aminopelargonate synthetase-like enzyme